MKETVEGIILIMSCHRYMHTRLPLLKLHEYYNGWKVIYVIGDLFIDSPYILFDNLLIIQCEDSYIHLLKKAVMCFEVLYQLFDIKQGILRCGDDIQFNFDNLDKFLKIESKADYMGVFYNYNGTNNNIESGVFNTDNYYMADYYQNHPNDFKDPYHGLENIDITKYNKIRYSPNWIGGIVIYFSNKSCNVLINEMKKVNYNIFHYDEENNVYPYYIEDLAYSAILHDNHIYATFYMFFFERNMEINSPHLIQYKSEAVVAHTNLYKFTLEHVDKILYGNNDTYIDVTHIILNNMDKEYNIITICNGLFGLDPLPGVYKHLIVNYKDGKQKYINENETFDFYKI